MKKIVIFQDSEVNGKKSRVVLRSITPSIEWQGYSRSGLVIDAEAKNLAKYLEPTSTGYFVS
jgi:hypothetical protein